MSITRPLALVLSIAALSLGAVPAAAQSKLLRFPDIHGERVVFTLRRRPLDRAGGRRHRDAPDVAPGHRAVREVLAGRQVDRVHRPVRRRRAGLRDAERGRRAEAAHVLPGPRPVDAALGLRQPGLRLVDRRDARSCSDRTATRGRCRVTRLYTVAADRRAGRGAADAGVGRRRLLARRQADRLLAALPRFPHPRSATAAARPTTCSSSTSPATTRRGSPIIRAPIAIRCGSAARSTSTPTAAAPSTSTPTTSPGRRRRRSRRRRRGTCAGRARTPQRPHRLRVERRAPGARRQDREERRRWPSRSPTTAWRAGRAGSRSARRCVTVELSPKGERALLAARGDIFTAPIEKGPTRNLTRSSGAHDKWPRWSPDGRTHRVHVGPVR